MTPSRSPSPPRRRRRPRTGVRSRPRERGGARSRGRRNARGARPGRPAALAAAVLALVVAGCGGGDGSDESPPTLAPGVGPGEMRERVEQFAPVTLRFDSTLLDARQRTVVKKLVRASDVLDTIFRRQVWRRNPEYGRRLRDAAGPGLDAARRYYEIMYGPWDRLEGDEPFLDAGPKPEGAGYYPPDMTRQEFESWVEEHPDREEAFTSYWTVVTRTEQGGLEAVPYAEHYGERLQRAAGLLEEAAESAENASLRRFLELRAESFRTNEYYDSEVAWVNLEDNLVEPTIGPYEVYEDKLFGYKAAFESFVTLKDPGESARLEKLVGYLPDLERALPVADRHKTLDRSFASPISVVDVVYTAGDTRAGVQTLAFNLPNDPRVRENEGSKKVMLKNVIEAKFRKILAPIAGTVLDSAQASRVGQEPYFVRILMHELAHGLGPDYVTGEPDVTVNKALEEHYSAIEEAKADVVGTHSLEVLTGRGVYPEAFLTQVLVGHAADLFRCVRFGAEEAHGKGCLVQFNFLREQGAIAYDGATGRYSVDLERFPDAVSALAGEILRIEAEGDYDGAAALLEEHGRMSGRMEKALGRLENVPVDIEPRYAVKRMMESW